MYVCMYVSVTPGRHPACNAHAAASCYAYHAQAFALIPATCNSKLQPRELGLTNGFFKFVLFSSCFVCAHKHVGLHVRPVTNGSLNLFY